MTRDEVFAAHRRLQGILRPTPLVRCEVHDAWLKLENLQVTGAFKVRGALNALAIHVERGDRRGVVAASAGNHARGVAWAARHLRLDACVVVPVTAPRTKVDGCRALGARVVAHGETYDDAVGEARRIAAREGRRFVHAFDDPDVIAGQGTVGVEMRPLEPDVVLVPIGGGGLAAGIAVAMDCRVVGVQVEGVDAMVRAMRGEEGPWEPAATVADGLRVRRAGVLTRRICSRLDRIVTVTEAEVRRAVAALASCDRVVAEGAGAAAVAALEKVTGRRKAAVVSGGNIDGRRLVELCAEQWTKSGSPA